MHSSESRRQLALPRRPEARAPYAFPLTATLAPVVVSGAVFVVTQSPLALVFAALGPVIAIGSLVDARLQARRTRRRETARFATETTAARAAIVAAHDAERAELELLHPSLRAALETPEQTLLPRWRVGADGVPIVLGSGDVASSTVVGGGPPGGVVPDEFDLVLGALASEAAVLVDAPIVVDAVGGVGLVGQEPLLSAAARSVVAHIVSLLLPTAHVVEVAGETDAWDWLDALPHRVERVAGPSRWVGITVSGDGVRCRVVVARDRAAIPGSISAIVVLGGGGSTGGSVLEHLEAGAVGGRVGAARITPALLSIEQAVAWAGVLTATAAVQGLDSHATVPESVDFADLASEIERNPAAPGGLVAAVARGTHGPVLVDLVGDGPHAIVGGTTGSGKSELLIAWVLSLARRYPPETVTFLLVDFKGGSSFGGLSTLPHCVGVITDLDESTAERALESLSAELRYRERVLAGLGARSVDEAPAGSVPRLVIVVDEFAALAAGFPDLHVLFGDIAARGRSLGVHLILCTQRPGGVIRDAVLANSAIRISLRVHTRADSVAVVGTDDAAHLPAAARGRAVIAIAGEPPLRAQVPLATADDIAEVAASRTSSGVPAPMVRRPWLDPLPTRVEVSTVPRRPGEFVFGLADHPAEQVQPPAVYVSSRHGNLLVVGGAGSGRTTTLAAFALCDAAEWLPGAPDEVWDAVCAALDAARSGGSGTRVLLLDDLDVVVARMSADHRAEFVDRLGALLREGPAASITMIVTVQRLAGQLQALATLCGSRLVLAMPDRQEHLLAGGDPAGFRPHAPAGAGRWQGHAVQVILADRPEPVPPLPLPLQLLPLGPIAAVSTRPQRFAERLTAVGLAAVHTVSGFDPRSSVASGPVVVRGAGAVLVADPATWQSHFGAVAELRATHSILVDGCSVAEFRAVTGCRQLPPPISSTPGACWLLVPDGTLSRVVLPAVAET